MKKLFDCTTKRLITLCSIVFVLSAILVGVTQSLNTINATSWGLSYVDNTSEPYVSIQEEYLEKYDVYYRGNKDKKNIYFTFDAGYDNGNTGKILDTLKKYNIQATFFLAGYFYVSQKDLVIRMVNEGHTIGNHTNNHKNMTKLSKEQFTKEINEAEALYLKTVGKEMPKYYRPPEGRYNEDNLKWIKEMGYKTIFWSLTHADWDTNKQPACQKSIDLLTKRIHNGAIILLHSVSATNATILDELIKQYINMGYKIRPISNLTTNKEISNL